MPVDYQQIRDQVRELGKNAPQRMAQLIEKFNQVSGLFELHHAELENITKRINLVLASNSEYRCAMPAEEDLHYVGPLPSSVPQATVLAVDGSQIMPSHHEAAEFAVINLGGIRYAPGAVPSEITRSDLLFDDGLERASGLLSEEMISIMRDVRERQLLAELAAKEPYPVVALTDGILEIYREPRRDMEFERQVEEYLDSLRRLAELRIAVAGYVDKTRADLVVRMLELMAGGEDTLEKQVRERPFRGVTDASLVRERLAPGDRSAVFGIQSRSSKEFTGELALHFFYLNVGTGNQPVLARVEIPKWVVDSRELLDLVHWTIFAQCRLIGSKPYPYVLHRAHEIAVIGLAEKEQIAGMINIELMKRGITPGEKSQKQGLKDLEGRKWKEK